VVSNPASKFKGSGSDLAQETEYSNRRSLSSSVVPDKRLDGTLN
jgi:hypothetical protein